MAKYRDKLSQLSGELFLADGGLETTLIFHDGFDLPLFARFPSLEFLNQVDADVITFESCSSGHFDLEAIGERITEKKVAIGMIDRHSLQVERPDEIAANIRLALKYIPAERLILSSDCGMGREGMARRHARYKMVSLVLGTNIVRKELGLPEAECLAADGRYSLLRTE